MDKIIRMVKINGTIYLHKEDVVSLIKEAVKNTSSLNAKSSMKGLAEDLMMGEEIIAWNGD
jgi:hypothetical protein